MATRVKTLRLPEDVCQTVEQFPGENFTEKFVSAARLLGRDREKLEKQLRDLEQARLRKYASLADMDKLLHKCDTIRRGLDEASWRLSDVVHQCRTVNKAVTEWTAQDTSNKDV